jgi:hypothetical protein
MDLDEVINFWDNTGLLFELQGVIKINTAVAYEKVAQKLLNDDTIEIYNRGLLETAIFPVIYKICKTGIEIEDINDFVEEFNQFIKDNYHIIHDLHTVSSIDIEAEFCQIFAEDYIEWYKENHPKIEPNKTIKKHKL